MSKDTAIPATTPSIAASTAFYLENSKLKQNGVREVPKAAFIEAMGKHEIEPGKPITEDHLKAVSAAINHEATAAAYVALADVEKLIEESSEEDLEKEEFRKKLEGTVRLPTLGGSTEVTVLGERWDNIPQRGDAEEGAAVARKVTHGRLRTTVNAKGWVAKEFHQESSSRIRAALGIKD